jgi:hypothetical protein
VRPLVYALAFTLAIVAGVAMGYFEDGGRVGPSPVLLYEDAAALVEPSPMADGVKGRATWYGARCPDGVSFLGRTDTCLPYVSKRDGGRGGELVMYAAVGWWRWGMTPVEAIVYFHATGRSVRVVVRDYCDACAKGRAVIDLSPMAFLAGGGGLTLGHGVAKVSVRYLGAR